MNYEDFIKPENAEEATPIEETAAPSETDLAVQKAVVESLAADKAVQDLEIGKLRKENYSLKSEIIDLKSRIEEMKAQLANVGDLLSRNSERAASSQVTLLERLTELDDRFDGETRDHVLEILKEARDAAEKDGRLRRAQILESVLLANEANGILAKKRQAIEKLFADNQNILNGQVINELDKLGIKYKVGENYLLAKEIIKREY